MRLWLITAFLAFAWCPEVHATTLIIATHSHILKPGERVQGIAFPPGTVVDLADTTNEVVDVQLKSDAQLEGRLFKKGTLVYLGPVGKINTVFTVDKQSFDGIMFGAEAQVAFSSQGDIEQAHIARDTRIGKATYADNGWVQFYPNGRVREGELALPLIDGPLHVAPGDVAFWPNGRIRTARLSQTAVINGVTCKAGDIALFASGHIDNCIADNVIKGRYYDCTDGRSLDAYYFSDQSVQIDYRGGSNRLDRLSPGNGHVRYANADLEWRPPASEAPGSIGTLIGHVNGEKETEKMECRYRGPGH